MPKKEKQGMVISNKMDKTVVVKVADYEPHPRYKKIMESNKHYKAHDAEIMSSAKDSSSAPVEESSVVTARQTSLI